MAYYNNRNSPSAGQQRDDYRNNRGRDRTRDGYDRNNRSHPGHSSRDRDRDQYHHNHRSQNYSHRSRSRSPHRGIARGSRIYHSHSRDRSNGGGGGGNTGGGGSGYYDRDAPPRSRSRSRTPTERFVSRDVIIEGFRGELTDDDIMKELVEGFRLTGVEKVTLIRDRKTGASRGFAFVHFSTTQDSVAFIDTFRSTIMIGEDRCRVGFSKERDEGERRGRRRDDEGEEWRCRACLLVNYPRRLECFRCATPKSEITLTGTLTHPTPTHFTNDGERDMATSPPSQFLLFRNLETGVNEEILSKGVLKLTLPNCPGGAEASSIKRVLLVRDRRTNESWRFGFAEFSTPQDAQKAFKSYEKVEKFTISSKPVTLSYIHPGVFVPVYNALEEAHRFTFLPLTPVGGGMRLAYWDEEGYVSELVLSDKEKSSNSGAEEKNNPPAGSGEKKSKKRKAENASGTDKSATASKKATSIPAHLQFWQNRHTELHGGVPATKSDRPEPGAEVGESSTDGHEATTGGVKGFSTPETGSQNESFADKNKLACLLCSRVFKSVEKLKHHERDSTLHATNLKDPALCEAARKKLPKNHLVSEYRDRARERRAVFGSSTAQAPSGNSQKKKQFMPKAEEEPDSVVEPMPNKGAALLGKMGWSHGQGLGATGAGTTQHVVVDMYTAGAGLGMKGAKIGDVEEVSRASAGGYQEFVRKTKERAKERYEEMG